MEKDNSRLGKISLWSSFIGVLPLCVLFPLAMDRINSPQGYPVAASRLLFIFFLFVELVAFGCGVMARRTATGKAGLVSSGLLLLIAGAVGIFR